MDSTAKILICDENEDFRRITSDYLKSVGFSSVSEAGDAAESLRKIKTIYPDIVIIDLDAGRGRGNSHQRKYPHIFGKCCKVTRVYRYISA